MHEYKWLSKAKVIQRDRRNCSSLVAHSARAAKIWSLIRPCLSLVIFVSLWRASFFRKYSRNHFCTLIDIGIQNLSLCFPRLHSLLVCLMHAPLLSSSATTLVCSYRKTHCTRVNGKRTKYPFIRLITHIASGADSWCALLNIGSKPHSGRFDQGSFPMDEDKSPPKLQHYSTRIASTIGKPRRRSRSLSTSTVALRLL